MEKYSEGDARDVLYASGAVKEGSFIFDENVARIFTDMAHRSIPGYCDIQNFTAYYAAQYVSSACATRTQNSKQILCGVLDIGASLGTSLASITRHADFTTLSLAHCSASACDNSPHMLSRARYNLRESEKKWYSISYECTDIADAAQRTTLLRTYTKGEVALRVVILHFVLQFTPPELRSDILDDVWNAMPSRSVLIVGEKLCANDERSQRVWDVMYKNFKRSMGYSDGEIEAKRKALIGVLRPMRESTFTSLLCNLPHSTVDAFFIWSAFHAYAVHKC